MQNVPQGVRPLMRCFGMTNRLSGGLRLFFYEYDDADEFDVLEDANFISQVFDVDIYVLKSSPRNYHILSFDMLTPETVNSMQNWTSIRGDYINGKDKIDGRGYHNTLRLGAKGKKPRPIFIKVFYAENDHNLRSLGHLNAWKELCQVPDPPDNIKDRFVLCGYAMISVYKTGIGAKPPVRPEVFRVR